MIPDFCREPESLQGAAEGLPEEIVRSLLPLCQCVSEIIFAGERIEDAAAFEQTVPLESRWFGSGGGLDLREFRCAGGRLVDSRSIRSLYYAGHDVSGCSTTTPCREKIK
jgi:hypothetical protein